jgi:hypothetical protein
MVGLQLFHEVDELIIDGRVDLTSWMELSNG